MIDTHCHIFHEYYNDIDSLINLIQNNNIKFIINNACNVSSCKEVVGLSNKYKSMYCALGLHPQEDLNEISSVIEIIKNNLNNSKFIAIGEIGLDYYWNKDNKDEQKIIFEEQLKLAEEFNLPVIIHSREATQDVLDIIKKYKVKGIIHCFNGSVEVAREYIKLGYKLGINGVITFNKCKLIDVIKEIGVDNIVFETDSPYLTPIPDRGKTNNPSYVFKIAEYLSENLGINFDELVDISKRNVMDIFDIKL